MDGLTISNSDGVIGRSQGQGPALRDTIRNTRASVASAQNPDSPSVTSGSAEAPKSFADTLKAAVSNVNQMQQEADVKMQELAVGKTQNIHDVMLTTEKADIALRLMVQVRNKIIEAYQEVMKMQV